MGGTVMNGPMPIMFDMFMEVAFRIPSRRCNCGWGVLAGVEFDACKKGSVMTPPQELFGTKAT
jgi:hypothetical protein